jgi:hypothetical protein
VEYLNEIFKYKNSITKLDIGNNNIGASGVKLLGDIFKFDNNIKDLNLFCIKILKIKKIII